MSHRCSGSLGPSLPIEGKGVMTRRMWEALIISTTALIITLYLAIVLVFALFGVFILCGTVITLPRPCVNCTKSSEDSSPLRRRARHQRHLLECHVTSPVPFHP